MVPVPLDHGTFPMISLDDLATDWWLKGGRSGGRMSNNLANLSISRTTLTHFPSLPLLKLENAYTIIRPELPILQNKLLDKLYGFNCAWMGDLLVVKHQHGNLDLIEDITPEDRALVDLLIKR